MPQIAVKWAVGRSGICCSLVGARTAREVDDNVEAVSTPLPAEITGRLDAVTQPLLVKLGDSFDYYESSENNRTRSSGKG